MKIIGTDEDKSGSIAKAEKTDYFTNISHCFFFFRFSKPLYEWTLGKNLQLIRLKMLISFISHWSTYASKHLINTDETHLYISNLNRDSVVFSV